MKSIKDIVRESNEDNIFERRSINSYATFVDTFDIILQEKLNVKAIEKMHNAVDIMIEGTGDIDFNNPPKEITYRVTNKSSNKVIAKIKVTQS